jgi:cyclophilin family peptidyl-prolyl cis-trans isomerase
MECTKTMSSGVEAKWSEIVRTEMDYNNKSSKATVYYYLDEQAFLDKKEPVFGEVIEVPYVEQEELMKKDVTEKKKAEESMAVKMSVAPNEEPLEEPVK